MLCVHYNYVYNYIICIIFQPTEKALNQLPMATGSKFKLFPRILRALYEEALTTSLNLTLPRGPLTAELQPSAWLGTCWTLWLLLLPKGCACSLSYKNTLASDICMTGTRITTAERLSLICFLFFVVFLVTHNPVYLGICSLSLLRECNLHARRHFIYLMCQYITKA